MRPLVLLLLLLGCVAVDHPGPPPGPLALRVTLTGDPGGLDPLAPLPFSSTALDLPVRVEAIGRDRDLMDWDGRVSLRATSGVLRSAPQMDLVGGVAEGSVSVALAFSELRVWVTVEGRIDEPSSYATGVSEPLWIDLPTLRQVQESPAESPLLGRFVSIKAAADPDDPRDLVVTGITNDGFYVADLSETAGEFGALFVFSFSRPNGIEVGDRLSHLSGNVDEFLGFTELGFPTWTILDRDVPVPPAPVLSPSIVCDDAIMEGWESAIVKVENLVSDFEGLGDCSDYNTYGQWPALLAGECDGEPARINVVNVNTVPSFGFPECENFLSPAPRELSWLIGAIRHTEAADPPWILVVRDCMDFPPEDRPADCPTLLERPRSGPDRSSHYLFREIPSCSGVPWGHH